MKSPLVVAGCSMVVAFLTSTAVGTVTIECSPVGGTLVRAGESVEIRCYARTDENIEVTYFQLDFACHLQALTGSIGSIDLVGEPDFIGPYGSGPSEIYPPMFSPGAFLSGFDEDSCTAAAEAYIPNPFPFRAGHRKFLASVFYHVSDSARGRFLFGLEGVGEAGSYLEGFGDIAPIEHVPTILSVPLGVCCAGPECLAVGVNRIECEAQSAEATFREVLAIGLECKALYCREEDEIDFDAD